MDRRSFLKSATATGLTVGLYKASANASMPEHNWDKYDWGSGLPVPDRLYQGPFPQYGPGAVVPDSDVTMITSPSKDIVSNYGMGSSSMSPTTPDHFMSPVRLRNKLWRI